jgi:hypothetical protein
MSKIQDEYSDLPVSRQRKHQLRNPEWRKEANARHRKTPARKKYMKEYMRTYLPEWRRKRKENTDKVVDST